MPDIIEYCEDSTGIVPSDFEERIIFSREMPYRIRLKHFNEEDYVPLHYATTIEILICSDLVGNIVIDNNQYVLCGKQVFVIPPYTVHSNHIEKCDGIMYIFKVDFSEMRYYFDIDAILKADNKAINSLAYTGHDYNSALSIIRYLLEFSNNHSLCISKILDFLLLLSEKTANHESVSKFSGNNTKLNLRELINWTQENFSQKITLDDVAKKFGYSKFYFCSLFKNMTGITYLNYLTSVRIAHARRLLRDGMTVKNVCYECGFNDVSYFVQVFKATFGVTPKQYSSHTNVIN